MVESPHREPRPRDRARLPSLPAAAAWVACLWCLAGCGREFANCEPGLCPAGTTCNASSGLCEAPQGPQTSPVGLFGRVTLLPLADGKLAVVGHAPAYRSLAFLSGQAGVWQTTFVAGPAAAPEEPAAGHVSAATVAPDGAVHLAWARAADATLWYAKGGAAGWAAEPLPVQGVVPDDLALGLWQGQPFVAWRLTEPPWVALARRLPAGTWTTETLPAPPHPDGDKPHDTDRGGALALAVLPSGPALAYHDPDHGDLMLAVRGAQNWSVSRAAGTDPATGADTGDVGHPVAATVGPDGTLVLAYLDRTRGQVRVARSKAGLLVHETVADGTWDDPETGTRRVSLLGTALSVAVLPGDRVAIAMLDASQLRLRVAVEKVAGGFTFHEVPGTQPQLWPSLLATPAGGLRLGYVELDALHGPAAGTVSAWQVPVGGAP